jgi:hypothetical protein
MVGVTGIRDYSFFVVVILNIEEMPADRLGIKITATDLLLQ